MVTSAVRAGLIGKHKHNKDGFYTHNMSKVSSLTERPSLCHYPGGSQATLLDFCTMQANTQQKSHGVMYY